MKAAGPIRLALSLGLLGVLGLILASWIEPKADLSFVFPRNSSPDIELLAERLQQGPSATLLLIALSAAPPERVSSETLARLSNRLARALNESGLFRFVANGNVRAPGPEIEALFQKRYLLNPRLTAEDFSAAALRAHLERRLEELGILPGLATKRLLPEDPTGRLQQVMRHWQDAGGSFRSRGTWLSQDQKTAFLMLRTAGEAYDIAAQQETLDFIKRTFVLVKEDVAVKMEMTGPIVFATRSSQVIRSEMQWLTSLSALLVIGLMLVVFRSLATVLAFVLPLGFGLCAGIFAVMALFGEIHGITLGFGGILIGISVDYPIHLASHMTKNEDSRAALRSIWPTLSLGMLTTVAAFLAMTFSSFPGLAQLGAFTITGLIAAALVTRWLLPLILAGEGRPPSPLWTRLRPTAGWFRVFRITVLTLALPAIFLLGLRGEKIWETDLRNLSPVPLSERALDRKLREQMGAADVRYLLVVRAPSVEEVLRRSEAIAEDLQGLVGEGQLAGFDMAARYLPSLESQERRQEALPEPVDLEKAMEVAAEGLPFKPGLFAPFLAAVSQSKQGPPLVLEDFREAGLDWLLEALLFQQRGDWVGLIAPQALRDPQALADLVATRNDPSLSFLDLQRGSEVHVADYRRETLYWLGVGAFVAVAVLMIGLRSVPSVLRVLTPIALSVLFTLSFLSLMGTAFSLFHLLALLLVAGVGLDYALFFERYAGQSAGWANTQRAVVLSAITTVSVFSILAFSSIPVLYGLGKTVAVGSFFSLVLAYIFTARSDSSQTCPGP